MRIDLPGLEAFLAIATWGSFRRAAGHLNLSQAALSHRLKKLEEELGVTLLARTSRQVSVTAAGHELLPVAQKMLHEVSATLDRVREQARTGQARIGIGCLPTVSLLHVPAALAIFRRHHPRVAVQIFDNSAFEIAQRVRSGAADFGVSIVSSNSADLEITPLLKDPFVLVVPTTHPTAALHAVSWQQLEAEPLIRISAEAANRVLIDDALGSRREAMAWRIEVQHVATAIELVRAGLGLAVVPQTGFEASRADGLVAVPLRNPVVSRTLGFVTRQGVPIAPNVLLLMRLFRDRLVPAGKGVATA